MSTLLVETLNTSLEQEIRLESEFRYSIGAIIPYLYLHNSPAGTFTLSIINEDDETVFSQVFTSVLIKTALGTALDYAHVFYPIIPSDPIQLDA